MASVTDKNDTNDTTLNQLRSALRNRIPESEMPRTAELRAFLHLHNDCVQDASACVEQSVEWRRQHEPITIDQIAEFLRTPSLDATYPDGCIVCLEDGKGDCARDKEGRPILVSIGMVHGSNAHELILQTVYAYNRARTYMSADGSQECCIIMEAQPRERRASTTLGYQKTFRFPDAACRGLFDFQKAILPMSQFYRVHFCGLSRMLTTFFPLTKPFLSKEFFERVRMNSSFRPLCKEISLQNQLPEWKNGGSFEFDIDAYIEWRAQQENVTVTVGPGQGRSFEPVNNGLPITSVVNTTDDSEFIKHGVCRKRGSGKGLFGSTKWKTKFLAVQPGCLLYFDSTDLTDTSNRVARSIDLRTSSQVKIEGESILRIKADNREFLFEFDSRVEAEQWLRAIEEASNTTDTTSDETTSVSDNDREE